jgi:hypothetical protein
MAPWGIIVLSGGEHSKGMRRTNQMPKVIRFDPGGGSVVEHSELSLEQAQNLATSLKAAGEPAGCCWCVGLWDDDP